jgi:hypothetical protein
MSRARTAAEATRHGQRLGASEGRYRGVFIVVLTVALVVAIPHVLLGGPWPWELGTLWHSITDPAVQVLPS